MSENMTQCIREALEEYKNFNSALPEQIIVYRDGVSDSQRRALLAMEVPQILSALEGVNLKVGLMVVVVNKRISTRLMAQLSGGWSNAPQGTVVDTSITSKTGYDFFLVSQKVTQGSITPTHYHVIYDTIKSKAEEIQMLTYKLCYMYFNWTGGIKVPAPCMFAHKLAYLVGDRGSKRLEPPMPHSYLTNTLKTLYYL
mmetsp:Transcript_8990/g.9727  ORF Transcript_8990/g.9727 Transcript_8990/m.9727 type:complete len:198 (-) Transcript_8990:36-629(-)